MKALVTGATGYIGSRLCARLVAEGWQVSALLRATGRTLGEDLSGRVAALVHDGSTVSVQEAVAAVAPDVVFHLASLFIAEHRSEQVTDLVNGNVLFGTQLAEACARQGVRGFINTGTSWQHFRATGYDPVCLYAATKQAFEDVLDYYADTFGLKVATLKLFDTYGPDDPRPKIVNLLLRAQRSGEAIDMSPGEQKLDLVHVQDVTRAFLIAAGNIMNGAQSLAHARLPVSSGSMLSLRELAGLIERIGARPLDLRFGARPYRMREVMQPWRAPSLDWGWTPQIGLQDGLRALLERD